MNENLNINYSTLTPTTSKEHSFGISTKYFRTNLSFYSNKIDGFRSRVFVPLLDKSGIIELSNDEYQINN